MAITEKELLNLLDQANLHYELHERTQEPVLLFQTYNYVNTNQQSLLMVVIQLSENGEYVKFFAPSAYYIENDDSSYAALRTLAIIAWRVKMVDFELDGNDGEVRPTVDFPLEDNTLTVEQIVRCCQSIAKIIDVMHPFIQHAIIHGTVHSNLLEIDIAKLMAHHIALTHLRKSSKEDTENLDIESIEDILIERLHEIQENRSSESNSEENNDNASNHNKNHEKNDQNSDDEPDSDEPNDFDDEWI